MTVLLLDLIFLDYYYLLHIKAAFYYWSWLTYS